MSEAIENIRPRYHVQLGSEERTVTQWGDLPGSTIIEWSFERAFDDLEPALSHARLLAVTNEHVRIVDREASTQRDELTKRLDRISNSIETLRGEIVELATAKRRGWR